ncbi:uncharacterized protein LOC126568466 [Anopheles maculipalpis]|uniref:uncharacterized protein LOC126568466 n=1 Tax=Anopheles maculipalpis TaxID=1496333 RepID=UPI0021598261|nr:uncharacterized protein LOC126568466 [Anopheles maculipalpis]
MQSNDETGVPVTELTSMCQTKQDTGEPTKDVHYTEGSFIFPPFSYHDTRNAERNATKAVPINSYNNVCHRAMRNHRGNSVHFSMGVYENETSSKTHCYTPYGRMRPYYIPHRTRTKSESSDPSNLQQSGQESGGSVCGSAPTSTNSHSILMETCEPPSAMMDVSSNTAGNSSSSSTTVRHKNPVVVLKKSRSLENVRVDNSLEGSQHSHEMEFVSSRIQKLKVQE